MDDLSEGEVAEAFGGPIFGAWRSNVFRETGGSDFPTGWSFQMVVIQ